MERVLGEVQYVLRNLCRMRDEVSAHPQDFDLDAQARLAEAITRIQDLLESTPSELMGSNQHIKAA